MKLFSFYRLRKQGFSFWLALAFLVLSIFLAIFAPWLPLKDPNALDTANIMLPPAFSEADSAEVNYWLGTDKLGRDVLANLIYGFRTGFQVAFPVMLVAMVVGIFLGSAGAYFGNKKISLSFSSALAIIISLFLAFFYGFYTKQFLYAQAFAGGKELVSVLTSSIIWLLVALFAGFVCRWLFKRLSFFRRRFLVPLDELVLKATEVLTSVPRLILVLSLAAISAPGLGNILLLLSLTYWAGPARLVRAEVLRIKQLPFIEAAQIAGIPAYKILFRHILPNAVGPLITAFRFGLGNLLALEATLSFLGIGLPPEIPSWGRMLNEARLNPEAWWLIFFPVLFLCLTILAVQTIGNRLRKSFI